MKDQTGRTLKKMSLKTKILKVRTVMKKRQKIKITSAVAKTKE